MDATLHLDSAQGKRLVFRPLGSTRTLNFRSGRNVGYRYLTPRRRTSCLGRMRTIPLSGLASRTTGLVRALRTAAPKTLGLHAGAGACGGHYGSGCPRCRHAAVNPAYIPRNHLVEAALDAAVSRQDFAPFEQLLEVLTRPFEKRRGYERYAAPPAPEERVHQTFCGT